jgi:hypothetical protein
MENALVVVGIHYDGNASMIFRGGSEHSWPTDVDIFDGLLNGAVGGGNRGFERVEVDDEQVDLADTVLRENIVVCPRASQ